TALALHYGNWSRELTNSVVEWMILSPFTIELRNLGASWSTVVEEGELVDSACIGGITSAIRAITSGVRGSTLGGGEGELVDTTGSGATTSAIGVMTLGVDDQH
nr:hypothetical protein [Tanacetum cinerariifolium]